MQTKLRRPVIHNIPDEWDRQRKIDQLLTIAEMLSKTWFVNKSKAMLDPEDIFQIASAAIVTAVDEYDPSFGVKLTTFAMSRARFAVRDGIREMTHTPRSMERKGMEVSVVSLCQSINGELTLEDVSSTTGLFGPEVTIEDEIFESLDRATLYEYIDRLPERERYVVMMTIEGIGRADIAQKLNVCPSRAYQIMQSAIGRMKGYVQTEVSCARANLMSGGYSYA